MVKVPTSGKTTGEGSNWIDVGITELMQGGKYNMVNEGVEFTAIQKMVSPMSNDSDNATIS